MTDLTRASTPSSAANATMIASRCEAGAESDENIDIFAI
ncbi:hypothetical protein FHT70_004898 [Rhizobium sp. BK049]|nr:hypothetical protein [Rhizobium sp. BK049]